MTERRDDRRGAAPDQPPRRAVALRYRQDQDNAPRVLAKGAGEIADRIIAIARAAGVALHEDRDLVKVLGALEIDQPVPPLLYAALAEVLAHIYRANRGPPPRPAG